MSRNFGWRWIVAGILVYLIIDEIRRDFTWSWENWIANGVVAYIVYRLIKRPKALKTSPLEIKTSQVIGKVPHVNSDIAAALRNQAELIINAYGKTLEYLSPNPGCVADEDKLPFTKAKIKAAIKVALRSAPDANQRAILEYGYLCLADFQAGVGYQNICLDLHTSEITMNNSSILPFSNTVSVGEAKKLLAKADAERILLTEELTSWNLP